MHYYKNLSKKDIFRVGSVWRCNHINSTIKQEESIVIVKQYIQDGEIILIQELSSHKKFPSITKWFIYQDFVHQYSKLDTLPNMLFPKNLQNYEFLPSHDGVNENLLILFHGLGDTCIPYLYFAKKMNLPQTAILSLQAPNELLFGLGHSWIKSFHSSGEVIKPTDFDKERMKSIISLRQSLLNIINILSKDFGWKSNRIFLFGFSQGASVALDLVMHLNDRMGGIVCISSGFIDKGLEDNQQKSCYETPLLMIHGNKDDVYPIVLAKKTKIMYQNRFPNAYVNLKIFSKSHEMISSPNEMKEVMSFFAQYLFLRDLQFEQRSDCIEITP